MNSDYEFSIHTDQILEYVKEMSEERGDPQCSFTQDIVSYTWGNAVLLFERSPWWKQVYSKNDSGLNHFHSETESGTNGSTVNIRSSNGLVSELESRGVPSEHVQTVSNWDQGKIDEFASELNKLSIPIRVTVSCVDGSCTAQVLCNLIDRPDKCVCGSRDLILSPTSADVDLSQIKPVYCFMCEEKVTLSRPAYVNSDYIAHIDCYEYSQKDQNEREDPESDEKTIAEEVHESSHRDDCAETEPGESEANESVCEWGRRPGGYGKEPCPNRAEFLVGQRKPWKLCKQCANRKLFSNRETKCIP